jgi:PKD repeat protein
VAAFAVQPAGGLVALTGSPFSTTGIRSEYQSVVVAPNQGPTSSFTSKSLSNPRHVVFDGSASADSDGSIVRYDWDFGDGQTLSNGGSNPSHDYQAPGAYNARLTLADNEGCSSTTIYTGQTASCNGAASALTKSVGVLGLKLLGKTQKLSRNGIKVEVDCLGVTCALDLGATVKLPKTKAKKSSSTKRRKPKKSKTVKLLMNGEAAGARVVTEIETAEARAGASPRTEPLTRVRSKSLHTVVLAVEDVEVVVAVGRKTADHTESPQLPPVGVPADLGYPVARPVELLDDRAALIRHPDEVTAGAESDSLREAKDAVAAGRIAAQDADVAVGAGGSGGAAGALRATCAD